MKHAIYCGLIALLCLSCSEETIPANNEAVDYKYFPLKIGASWTYKVDSIVFNKQLGTVDTLSSELRESISNKFVDESDNEVFRVDRTWRKDQGDFVNNATYTSRYEGAQVLRVEENLTFVKLSLPPKANKKWDGNSYFDNSLIETIGGESIETYKGNWDYQYVTHHDQIEFDGQQFNDVWEVSLVDDENSIEKRFAREWYAADIGLVRKEWKILDSQSANINLPFEQRAEKGYILTQTLIAHQ